MTHVIGDSSTTHFYQATKHARNTPDPNSDTFTMMTNLSVVMKLTGSNIAFPDGWHQAVLMTSSTAKRVVWLGTRGGDDVSMDQADIAIDDVLYWAACEGGNVQDSDLLMLIWVHSHQSL